MPPEFVGLTDIDDPHAISRSRIESVESQFKRLVVINSGLRQPCTRHGLAVESEMGHHEAFLHLGAQTAMRRFEMRGVSLPCGIYTGHPFRREIAQIVVKAAFAGIGAADQRHNLLHALFIVGQRVYFVDTHQQPLAVVERQIDLVHQRAMLVFHRPATLVVINRLVKLLATPFQLLRHGFAPRFAQNRAGSGQRTRRTSFGSLFQRIVGTGLDIQFVQPPPVDIGIVVSPQQGHQKTRIAHCRIVGALLHALPHFQSRIYPFIFCKGAYQVTLQRENARPDEVAGVIEYRRFGFGRSVPILTEPEKFVQIVVGTLGIGQRPDAQSGI